MKPVLLNGRYLVRKVFADSGGMGVIYDAIDQKCRDNPVLIKTTRYDGGNNARHFRYTAGEAVKHIEKLRKILAWEKKILVRFKNEKVTNIPSPNDFFTGPSLLLQKTYDGRQRSFTIPDEVLSSEPYLVMERIHGAPLSKVLKTNEFRARAEIKTLQIVKEVLTIFIRLHRKVDIGPNKGQFIYQDLKPANVLMSPGDYVTLIDMGAVTLKLGGRTTEPTAGCITAGYAAPEASDGRESAIDTRFDLYTLGVTAWQVLTGLDPQELGGEFPEIPLRPLEKLALHPQTLAVLRKALARHPDERFQTAAAMRKAVIAAQQAVG